MATQTIMELTEAYATDCAHGRDCRNSHAELLVAVQALEKQTTTAIEIVRLAKLLDDPKYTASAVVSKIITAALTA